MVWRARDRQVRQAAKRIGDYLYGRMGGFPCDVEIWKRELRAHNIAPFPVWNCPGLTATTEQYLSGLYVCFYNPDLPLLELIGCFAHEESEVIAVQDEPCFWDLPEFHPIYHHNGGSNPEDARHRVARLVELRVLRELRKR